MGMRPGIILLREGTDTSQGIPQLISNINACQVVADTVKTTLGPAGRDKLIAQANKVTISNDGATLMRLLEIQHPAAKTLVDISISQDVQVGDGTTSVVLLAAELLSQLKSLIEEGVHPQLLGRYLQQAGRLAVETVRQMAVQPSNPRETLLKTASTALNSKLIANHQDLFAPMVVDAVTTLHNAGALEEMDHYITIKQIPGGDVRQSFLVQGGVAFAKTFSYAGFEQMTKRFAPAKLLLLNVELELKAEKENAEVRISSPADYQAIVDAEWHVIFEKLEHCVQTGANIVLSKLPIGDLATQYFLDRGLFCAGRVPDADLKRVAKATGGAIQTTTQGLSSAVLGTCGVFEEKQVGDARFNVLTECPVQLTSTIVLRGGTEQFIAESERSVHDALEVVKRAIVSQTVVAGGGAVEMHVASILRQAALKIAGKGQLIYLAFAKALEVIPRQLCDNAGFDPTEVLADLRRQHANVGTVSWYGVDLTNGGTCDTMESGVWEPSDNKIHSLDAATEAACVILSIDETVIAAPSQDPGAQATGMMGGGGGGAPTMSNMMNTAMQTAQSNGPRSGKLAPGVSYMKGRGGG
ncbi:T-complex protein 1 subunit eta [Fistulifera solaris]|uniref:CCT-eta n=1 Tax=Fistulifera solaris TaxID=1519565 RepID=A0A1Z5K1S6_FISSO|nr:T-complex protein 1 subunit eta [Fistulifera solaris]|eukprot:GAX20230.1 T-complex protein 1 subunit eta [Fistulifera solaris]